MKKIIIFLIVGLLLPQIAPAQGTLYVSNLGQTPTDSMAIGSDSWIAQMFGTGTDPNGYSLDSIQLLMNPALGSPGDFTVSIYSSPGNGAPGSDLGNLTGSDPAAGGIFTYTASGLTLSPSTFYFVVLTSATEIASGSYSWSAANGANSNGWLINDVYYSSTDGSTWTSHVRQDVFQMAIYATPVPEPSILGLLGLGVLLFFRHRRKAKGTQTDNQAAQPRND